MSYFGEVIGDAPVAYWRLGEASGVSAADASGNGRTGTYVNSPGLAQAGALASDGDTAVLFDGTNDRVDLPALPAIGTTLTIEFWINPSSGGDASQLIIGEADASPEVIFKTNKISVVYAAADHFNTTPLAYGVWHHVVISIAAGAGTFYIDGVVDGSFASFPTGFAPDRIGDDTPGNTFKGYLDEVAVYLSALSAARAAAHYSAAWRGFVSLRPRLRRMLHDEDAANYRWTDAELERHVLRAVDELSEAWPDERKTVLVTTPASRDLSITTLTELVRIEAVEWPVAQFPPAYVQFQTWGTVLTLLVAAPPTGAESVNVFWGRRHAVERLTSTLLAEVEETALAGAAGYAALEWASFAVNRANVGGQAVAEEYMDQATAWLTDFRRGLRRFGRGARVRTSQLYRPERTAASKQTVSFDA